MTKESSLSLLRGLSVEVLKAVGLQRVDLVSDMSRKLFILFGNSTYLLTHKRKHVTLCVEISH